jgi:hypothetical protein
MGPLVIVAALAAASLGGCGSDDPVKPPPPPPQTGYPARTSPQNVLSALTMAYAKRDSIEYKSLYDSTYVGTSTNLNDPPGNQTTTFYLYDEGAHIAALARTTTITSVVLDFGPSSSWTRLASDDPSHPEWAVMQVNNMNLQIYDGATLYSGQATNPMTFTFRPSVAAPGDTTWKIVRWNELGGVP